MHYHPLVLLLCAYQDGALIPYQAAVAAAAVPSLSPPVVQNFEYFKAGSDFHEKSWERKKLFDPEFDLI